MTWTYDPTDLSTDLARVRLEIGDTNTNDQGLTDEEINYYLVTSGLGLAQSTLRCAEALYARWVRDVDRSNLGMSANRSQKLQHLKDLIDGHLRPRHMRRVTPYLGGVSESAKDSLRSDTDAVQPGIRKGQFDNGR